MVFSLHCGAGGPTNGTLLDWLLHSIVVTGNTFTLIIDDYNNFCVISRTRYDQNLRFPVALLLIDAILEITRL